MIWREERSETAQNTGKDTGTCTAVTVPYFVDIVKILTIETSNKDTVFLSEILDKV